MATSPERPQAQRKHITTACLACRESKIKCDGCRPKCSNCLARARDCVYQQGEDRRRLSLRKAVKVFSNRIAQLEGFIRQLGLEVPGSSAEDEKLMKMMMDSNQLPPMTMPEDDSEQSNGYQTAGRHPHPMPPPPFTTESESPESNPSMVDRNAKPFAEAPDSTSHQEPIPQPHPYDSLGTANDFFPNIVGMDTMSGFNLISSDGMMDFPGMNSLPMEMAWGWDAVSYPSPDAEFPRAEPATSSAAVPDYSPASEGPPGEGVESPLHSEDEDADDVINQISDRMGSLHLFEHGELRYYGATSNLNLLDDASHLHQQYETHSIRVRGQTLLERAGIGQVIDPVLEEHLINLYFAWQDPSFHVMDRDIYEKGRRNYLEGNDGGTFYSETLTNTLCAFGALYDGLRPSSLPTPLSDFFAKRAKIWLDIELDSPRVATVQALVILSSFMAGTTNDARGWSCSGMAMRLSCDLGLHMDMTPYVYAGRMSAAEAEVRKVAFWGSYVVDHLWGFYLGRPPYNIREISVQKPSGKIEESKCKEWIPYGLSNPRVFASASRDRLIDPIESVHRQWVILCEIMGALTRVFYERVGVTNTMLQPLAEKAISQLDVWKRNLPAELLINFDSPDAVYLPNVLILHMQYYQFLIYIHRPFVSRHNAQAAFPLDSSFPQAPRWMQARASCVDAAVAISRLLRIYKSAYTLQFANVEVVSIIFSAAVILVFASVSDLGGFDHNHSNSTANLTSHLDTCCQALAELGKTFQNATRTLEVLLAIKRKWQAKLLVSTGSKRRSSGHSRPSATCSKRLRSQMPPKFISHSSV